MQAGDQVSFELVGSRRLVVKCIQPGAAIPPASTVRSAPDSPDSTDLQPAKARRSPGCSSPSRAASDWKEEVSPHSWLS